MGRLGRLPDRAVLVWQKKAGGFPAERTPRAPRRSSNYVTKRHVTECHARSSSIRFKTSTSARDKASSRPDQYRSVGSDWRLNSASMASCRSSSASSSKPLFWPCGISFGVYTKEGPRSVFTVSFPGKGVDRFGVSDWFARSNNPGDVGGLHPRAKRLTMV